MTNLTHNEFETYFHVTAGNRCEGIARRALEVGKVELVGRSAASREDYEWVGFGEGFIFAAEYSNREGCWEYANTAHEDIKAAAMFVLGVKDACIFGDDYVEPIVEDTEVIVSLGSYEVVAVIVTDGENETVYQPLAWAAMVAIARE